MNKTLASIFAGLLLLIGITVYAYKPEATEVEGVQLRLDNQLPNGLSILVVQDYLKKNNISFERYAADCASLPEEAREYCHGGPIIEAHVVVGQGACGWFGRDKVDVVLEFGPTELLVDRSFSMPSFMPYDLC